MPAVDHRKRYFLNHKKSSALVASMVIHALFIVAAVSFVAVRVIVKAETTFEVKKVSRPTMKLRKLQVPVKDQKKAMAPKLRQIIISKPKTEMNIKMPEIVGVIGGTGYGRGEGLGGLGFGFKVDLFGSSRGSGNEFVGTLYDLKLDRDQEPVEMSPELYFEELGRFCGSWNESRLNKYFKAPRQKYATVFYFPEINADEAPKAFGVEDVVKPELWVIHYKGTIAAPETGEYRFWGYGDDVLIVRVGRQERLQANWNDRKAISWSSDDDMDQQYKVFGQRPLFIGDWFRLDKGKEVPVDILVGECSGNKFACALLIEKKGSSYATSASGGPLLPLFKTSAIPDELLNRMNINPGEVTSKGPLFGVLENVPEQ